MCKESLPADLPTAIECARGYAENPDKWNPPSPEQVAAILVALKVSPAWPFADSSAPDGIARMHTARRLPVGTVINYAGLLRTVRDVTNQRDGRVMVLTDSGRFVCDADSLVEIFPNEERA